MKDMFKAFEKLGECQTGKKKNALSVSYQS